jgi:signal transduction histidine kinase
LLLSFFRRIFTPPVFLDDERKTNAAVILHWILWVIFGLVLVMAPFIYWFYSSVSMPVSAIASSLAGPVCFICLLVLLHRGYVSLAAWALVVFQWVSTLFQVALLGGLSGPAAGGYVVAILLAGALINDRAALLFLGLSVASLIGIDFSILRQWAPELFLSNIDLFQKISMTNTLISAWVILSLVMRSHNRTLKKIDANARNLEIERGALQTINRIGRAVAALGNLEAVLDLTRQQVERNLPLDAFFIALYDPDTKRVSFPLVYEAGQYWDEPDTDLMPETNLSQVLISGEPTLKFIAPEEVERYRGRQSLLVGDHTQVCPSLIFVPLRSMGKVVGAISAQSYEDNAYTEDDLHLLDGVATQVMIAIENARLFTDLQKELEEKKRLISELEEKNRESETQQESAAIVVSTLKQSEVAERILDQLQRVVPFDSASIQLLQDRYLTIAASRGLPVERTQDRFIVSEADPAYPVLTGEVPYRLFGNVQEVFPVFREPDYQEIQAWLGVALKVKGNVFGIIALDGHKVGQFSERHAQLAGSFANQVAIALENARLFASVQVELAERKRAEDEVRSLNEDLEMRVQERTRELQATYRELESFSYSISHDLRAPLRALDGYSRILLEDYADDLDEQANFYLKRIRGRAQYMGQLIDDLLAFSRLGRQPLRIRCISGRELREMINQVIQELAAEIAPRVVEVQIGQLQDANADATLFRQVWVNLLSNAIKFTRFKEKARIEIGSCETERGIVYSIADNGAGFDMDYASKLFGVFQRLHRFEDFEGTGVGLAIVKRIIERHGGSVWANAQVDQGANFYFSLQRSSEPISLEERSESQSNFFSSPDGLE